MIAQELEVSLHMAFVEARQKRHEFITVEHLLLALIDNPSAADALRACGGSVSFTVYPGIGHDAWTPAYEDPALLPWLLAQRRP